MRRDLGIKLLFTWLLLLAGAPNVYGQISITFSFSNGSAADADQVNTNFSVLGSQALNRTGGTITGNIAVNNGITIDGLDLSASLGTAATPTFAGLTISGTGASSLDIGGGLNAGTGNVALIDATGKIAGIASTTFANLSGANLTTLNASNISTGTLAVDRGGTGNNFGVASKGAIVYIFADAGPFAQLVPGTAGQFLRTAGAAAAPTWSNDGSNLTGLLAANLTGTVPSASLTGTYSSALTLSSASNTFVGNYKVSTNTTGVSAVQMLNSNCPAANCSNIYTWFQFTASDGSTVYVPVWK